METAPGTSPGISLPTVGSRGECLVKGWGLPEQPRPGSSAQRLSLGLQVSAGGLAGAIDAIRRAGGLHSELLPQTALPG